MCVNPGCIAYKLVAAILYFEMDIMKKYEKVIMHCGSVFQFLYKTTNKDRLVFKLSKHKQT